jgi:hypothetical protein
MSVSELRKSVAEEQEIENVEGKTVGDWSASRITGASLVVVLPHPHPRFHQASSVLASILTQLSVLIRELCCVVIASVCFRRPGDLSIQKACRVFEKTEFCDRCVAASPLASILAMGLPDNFLLDQRSMDFVAMVCIWGSQ